jgi:hypothetical protein
LVRACTHNRSVASRVGLMEHVAMWESLECIIKLLALDTDGNISTERYLDGTVGFATSLGAHLLSELLDRGDCQHFVVCCEILRNGGLLRQGQGGEGPDGASQTDAELRPVVLVGGGTSSVAMGDSQRASAAGREAIRRAVAASRTEEALQQLTTDISSTRQREGYVAYIDLLRKFRLEDLAACVISTSNDPYLGALSRQGTSWSLSCAKCGKQLQARGHCSTCSRSGALCSLCCTPVQGLCSWCPICGHGGHTECTKLWFAAEKECPAGCGHSCAPFS